MGEFDNTPRAEAIPYYANIWGYNRTQNSDTFIDLGTPRGDLNNLAPSSYGGGVGSPAQINPVRVLQPAYGAILNATLTIRFKLANAEAARQLRIAVGYFASRYDAETTYTSDYLDESHLKITGRETPFTIPAGGWFDYRKLNLTPAMYQRGHARFLPDAFVIVLAFDSAPSNGTGWQFAKFEVNCTATMGLR